MSGYIKLTSAQKTQLDAFSSANRTNHFIAARRDVNNDWWLTADCLAERTTGKVFSGYNDFLKNLSVTQQQEPVWPKDQL